jgi:hypothetical protein
MLPGDRAASDGRLIKRTGFSLGNPGLVWTHVGSMEYWEGRPNLCIEPWLPSVGSWSRTEAWGRILV